MSVTISEQQRTNIISGKVVLRDSAIGIPDLLVVIYDLDPGTKPEEVILGGAAIDGGLDPNTLGDRLGSVLTDADGAFALGYEDTEFRIRDATEKRPDLLIHVLAPEQPGALVQQRMLYSAIEARQNAGRVESYYIALSADGLTKAGLPVPEAQPSSDDDVKETITALGDRLRAGKRFSTLRGELLRTEIEADHAQHAADRDSQYTVNVRDALSMVPKGIRDSDAFVADGADIFEAVMIKTQNRVDAHFNQAAPDARASASGYLYLTQAQIADYAQYVQGDEYVLPPEVVQRDILPAVFGGGAGASANDFLMNHPAVRACIRRVKGELTCPPAASDADGDGVPDDAEAVGTGDPAPATAADVKLYIARQMEHVSSPEGVVNFGVDNRARPDASDIAGHVAGLHLRQGPADSPAYFDLHVLNIAFDYVWKEAVDQGIVEASEALYDQAVVLGQQPRNVRDLARHFASLNRFMKNEPQQEAGGPPVEVLFEFPDAVGLWPKLTANEKVAVTRVAHVVLGKYNDSSTPKKNWVDFLSGKTGTVPYIDKTHLIDRGALEVIGVFRQKGQRILDAAQERNEEHLFATTDLDRYRVADDLARSLLAQLNGRYAFTYFAADAVNRSVNFGVLLTYRQIWKPVGYSAGELVGAVPLAPGENRKFNRRTLVRKSRSEKEMEENVRMTRDDQSDTSRSESEIVRKAMEKSTFSMGTSMNFDLQLELVKLGGTVSTNMTKDAQRDSSETKKAFRESVLKASQEYRSTRRTEISLDTVNESESTESGEISNVNRDITVTYLFFELQRQFRVNERLHRMRPVILVAQEMPAPHEIDDDWIVRHDWMLKRALLDDSFLYGFDGILSVRGDALMLSDIERTVTEQRKITRDLRQNVRFYTDETGRMSRLMQAAISKQAGLEEDRDFWDAIPLIGGRLDGAEGALKGIENLFGFGQGDDPKEAARIRREGIKDAFERADRERRELMGRLERETGVLNELTRDMAEKRKAINEKQVAIARLKTHLKDNILHYMHAIWRHEHPDQRFFRLFNTRVPQLSAPAADYHIRIPTDPVHAPAFDAVANLGLVGDARKVRHVMYCRPVMQVEQKTLAEVAELDTLLGFKGNYMIFPMRHSNVLTDFMMAPYVDSEFGLLDPDAAGNWSLEEFEDLYCCLKAQLGEEEFGALEEALKAFYAQLLQDPLRPNELISIPTSSLLIEALPGAHPVLEDYMVLHRAVDVKKVQAEVRKLELENIRYAARILEGERGDPDVEKRVIIEGSGVTVNPDTD